MIIENVYLQDNKPITSNERLINLMMINFLDQDSHLSRIVWLWFGPCWNLDDFVQFTSGKYT